MLREFDIQGFSRKSVVRESLRKTAKQERGKSRPQGICFKEEVVVSDI